MQADSVQSRQAGFVRCCLKKVLLAQRQKTLQSDFSVLPSKAPTPANNTSDSAAADTSWQDALEYTQKGELKNTLRNITIILENDPKLKNIVFNQLADNMEIVGEVPWKHPTRFWRDADDSQLISYIEFNYGSFSQRNYEVTVTKVADDRSYHPIREMFASLPAWDGVKRVDSLLIDYLGAEDNEYVRAVIVDNICVAEELMQETFVRLAVKKPKFKGKMYFKTWLYSIAKHCALDYLRKSSKMADFPIDEAFLMSDEEDIERQYLKEEQKIELHRAMRRLKPEYAQVLYLMYFEDFDTAEIARIMKKSKRQIGDLLYRAKKTLKTELEKEGFVYEEY